LAVNIIQIVVGEAQLLTLIFQLQDIVFEYHTNKRALFVFSYDQPQKFYFIVMQRWSCKQHQTVCGFV